MTSDYAILAEFSDAPPKETTFARWPGQSQGIIPANKVRLMVDGKLVGWCGLHPTTATVSTGRMSIVGLGGVQIISTERRKGYGRLLVQQASSLAIHKWKPEALVLFSFENTREWYETMGWRVYRGQVVVQPQTIAPVHVMTIPQVVGDAMSIKSLPW